MSREPERQAKGIRVGLPTEPAGAERRRCSRAAAAAGLGLAGWVVVGVWVGAFVLLLATELGGMLWKLVR